MCGSPSVRCGLPLGALPYHGPAPIAAQFRAFLSRTEPDLALFTAGPGAGPAVPPFGLVDEAGRSVAFWDAGELIGYGGHAAAARLAQAYARWAELGLPGLGSFQLTVHRAEAAPPGGPSQWIESRGATALAWTMKPDAASWLELLNELDRRPLETGPDPS